MSKLILPGETGAEVVLRRSARARRMTLRVSRLDGRVTLTVPAHISDAKARAFAHDRSDWVAAQLRGVEGLHVVADGSVLPIEGVETPMAIGRSAMPGEIAARSAPALAAHLKALARDRLAAAVDHYCDKLGRRATALTLRDTRSRWGSCSAAGRLMFSWRLILAPPNVLNYVAAHEVAHLQHMDHSRAFWAKVEALEPGHAPHRQWLKEHGPSLHRFQFDH